MSWDRPKLRRGLGVAGPWEGLQAQLCRRACWPRLVLRSMGGGGFNHAQVRLNISETMLDEVAELDPTAAGAPPMLETAALEALGQRARLQALPQCQATPIPWYPPRPALGQTVDRRAAKDACPEHMGGPVSWGALSQTQARPRPAGRRRPT